MVGGSVMFRQNVLDNGLAGRRYNVALIFSVVVVDMELENVFVINGIGDGVLMELLLEDVFCGDVGGCGTVNFCVVAVVFEDWRSGETEHLGVREEIFNHATVLAKLAPVTFIENEDNSLVLELAKAFYIVLTVVRI